MKKLLISALAIVTMIGCTKDETIITTFSDGAISFTAGLSTRVSTTDDCAWAEGDKIGVYTNLSGEENLIFSITDPSTGAMTKEGDQLYTLITAGEGREYYAYHPYTSTDLSATIVNTISIDRTTDQSEPLLWAMASKTNLPNVELQFAHMYAKVTIALDSEVSLKGKTATLTGAYAKANFSINSGEFSSQSEAEITLTIGENNTITAYMIPQTADVTILVDVTGDDIAIEDEMIYAKNIQEEWLGGNSYDYTIVLGEGARDLVLAGDTYYIYTAEGLAAFRDLVNGSENTTSATVSTGMTFPLTAQPAINGKLMNDIDLSSVCGDGSGETADASWTPIGDSGTDINLMYSGTFDGGGYEVSGLYINSTNWTQALFGYVCYATISNLGVSGEVTAGSYPDVYTYNGYGAGLVASADNSSIENCYNKSKITGRGDDYGGLVGNAQYSSIKNCSNYGYIYGDDSDGGGSYIGGIVGSNFDSSIENCYNYGTVDGRNYVGGIVGNFGSIYSASSITACSNFNSVEGSSSVGGIIGLISEYFDVSSVKNCSNTSDVKGNSDVGGIVGMIQNNTATYATAAATTSITACYNTCTVYGQSSIGGLLGEVYGSASITDSYNTGHLECVSYYVGGLVGYIGSASSCSITTSYSCGSINLDSGYTSIDGLIGIASGSYSISDSYYDNDKFSYNGVGTVSATCGLSTTDMKNGILLDNFANGSSTAWQEDTTPNINDGYPILSWQLAATVD